MVDRTNGRRFIGALRAAGVSVGNLPWHTQVGRVLAHLLEMDRLVTEVPGPWMAKLYGDGVEIVWPPELRTLP